MGGFGSGKPWRRDIKTTSGYYQLDIRHLHRKGLLTPEQAYTRRWFNDEDEVICVPILTEIEKLILLHQDKRKQEHCYGVPLVWTACNYGGARPWFMCPVAGCPRRVAKLYLVDTIFACRHCYKLIYFSQLQTPEDRAIRRADKIRERLGWEPGILDEHEDKPKGMHWQTFDYLVDRHDELVIKALKKVAGLLGQ